MKILHILNELEFSGAEVMLAEAAPIFRRNLFDLHILSTGTQRGTYAEVLHQAGFSIRHIPFFRSPGYLLKVYRFIRSEGFDIVHVHAERAFFWHSLAARLAGAGNVVRTIHSVFPFQGFLRRVRLLQRWFAREVLGVIFISIGPSVFKKEQEVFHNRTTLISNWVNEAKYLPAVDEAEKRRARKGFGVDDATFVIISVGVCNEGKNHKDVIAALDILNKGFGGVNYLHVGEGPLLEPEKQFAASLGLLEQVRFAGVLRNVRDALIAADVFIMTSRKEGLSRASLEALSCGLPGVVYNADGLKDIIDDGKNGFIVEQSPEAIALKVGELIGNEKRKSEMSLEARKKAARFFSMEDSVRRLVELYKERT